MTIRVVTTCHKAGWEQYGQKCLAGWKHFPDNCELHWYTEGYTIPETDRVKAVDNESLTELQAFKSKYSYFKAPWYTFDVVRFSHKVFAVADALKDHDGLGVWMDADIVPFADIPEGYIESLLPRDTYIALFKRTGMHSECGFWVVDCTHRHHKLFLNTLLDMYRKDAFKEAQEWHDSYLMDIVLRNLEKQGVIRSFDLSGEHAKEEHPMAKADIARFVDHLKGLDRKKAGFSAENEHRAQA